MDERRFSVQRSNSLRELVDQQIDVEDNLVDKKDKKKHLLTLSKMHTFKTLKEPSLGKSAASVAVIPDSRKRHPTISHQAGKVIAFGDKPNKRDSLDVEKRQLLVSNLNMKKQIANLESEMNKLKEENSRLREEVHTLKSEAEANEARLAKMSKYCDNVNKVYFEAKENYQKLVEKMKDYERSDSPKGDTLQRSSEKIMMNPPNFEKLKKRDSLDTKPKKSPRNLKDEILEEIGTKNKTPGTPKKEEAVFLPELMSQKELKSYLQKIIQSIILKYLFVSLRKLISFARQNLWGKVGGLL